MKISKPIQCDDGSAYKHYRTTVAQALSFWDVFTDHSGVLYKLHTKNYGAKVVIASPLTNANEDKEFDFSRIVEQYKKI